MPGYLGNFLNAWVSGKFLKCLGICEISQVPRHLRNFQNLKNIPPSNTCRNLGNFPNAWVSAKFPKCLGIWEISQMPGFFGNPPNIQSFEKFPNIKSEIHWKFYVTLRSHTIYLGCVKNKF